MTKYRIPEGMLRALGDSTNGMDPDCYFVRRYAEAMIKWLAENPIVPTDNQIHAIFKTSGYKPGVHDWKVRFCEWQRLIFLEPEVPEVIKDLLYETDDSDRGVVKADLINLNSRITEAYNRGQKAG